MLKNSLKITELNNTYVQNKDPKLYMLIKYIVDDIDADKTSIQNLGKSVTNLTSSTAAGGNVPDSILAMISLRV